MYWRPGSLASLVTGLLGIMGDLLGRHRKEEHGQADRLVCPQVGLDPVDMPSNVRGCADCGAQVWVSPGAGTALVDSGQLAPQCPTCWFDSGKTLTLHPDCLAELTAAGLRERGWRRVGQLNYQLSADDGDSCSSTGASGRPV